jgi:hypothetical protein
MDMMYTSEFFHQIRKSCRLRVPRKHGVLHHDQSAGAEVKKLSNLSDTVLESNNSSSTVLARPEITTTLISKPKKNPNSRINTLILNNNINKGT